MLLDQAFPKRDWQNCDELLQPYFCTACCGLIQGPLVLSSPPRPYSWNTTVALARTLPCCRLFFPALTHPTMACGPCCISWQQCNSLVYSLGQKHVHIQRKQAVVQTENTFKCMSCVCSLKPGSATQILPHLYQSCGFVTVQAQHGWIEETNLSELATGK